MLYILEFREKEVKIIFSSVLSNVTEVIDDSTLFLDYHAYNYDSFSLKLALAEGLTNALKHGNSMNPNLNVVYFSEYISWENDYNF